MRRSPSTLLCLCNSSTHNSSTIKHSTHPHSSRTFWLVAGLMACLFIIASPLFAQQTPVLVTQIVDNSVRTVLPGNVHPLARPEFDEGEAPADLVLHRLMLVLKHSPQQETAMRRFIENQQYKKSPSYHQWLTPVEFGAQFGPAESDIAAVTNWLQASGFQVSPVSNGRSVIEFSGTVGQVKQAFGTAIHKYVVKGEQHLANVSNPSVPTALAPVIAGVNSLYSFRRKTASIHVGTYSEKTKQLTSPQPAYTFNGGCFTPTAGNCYALGPYDFATIYDLLPLWSATPAINGTGQTIAIVGDTDINKDDAPAFWSLFGLDGVNAPKPTLNIIYNGPNPGFNSDESEADIDTQWSGAAAPGATIDFVTSEDTETDFGVDLSALYIVDNNLGQIMSESIEECEADMTNAAINFYSAMWAQAAAQGISVMVAAGDNGSAGCDNFTVNLPATGGLAVNGLASTPYNVAVGGTDFNQNNAWSTYWNTTNEQITQQSVKTGKYIPETSWNDSCTNALWQPTYGTTAEEVCNSNLDDVAPAGGSGGASTVWLNHKPAYQKGAGVPKDNTRDIPDVSLFASNGFVGSFYLICQSDAPGVGGTCTLDNLQGYGGTSVASPAFAGIMALVNQKMGSAQGNPNFVLYQLPTIAGGNSLHDIPAGSTNAMPCATGSPNCVTNTAGDTVGVLSGYNTTAAYDLATGLGSVDVAKMAGNWATATSTFTPTTTNLTLTVPANTTHGTTITVTVDVSPNGSAPYPTGDVALLVAPGASGPPANSGIDWNSLGPPAYANGTASWPTTFLPGGTYQVIAHYEGDTIYGGSYSDSEPSQPFTINPEASSVFMGTPPGLVVGQNQTTGADIYGNSVVYGTGAFDLYLLRADVKNSQGNFCNPAASGNPPPLGPPYVACPTGSISFTDSNSVPYSASLKLNSYGYTEDQAIQLAGGTHALVANYSGDSSYKASTTTATVTVAKATSVISNVATSLSTVNTGQQFTVTATVNTSLTTNTSFGLAPTGTVSFFYSGTLLGVAQTTATNGSYNPFTGTGTPASLAASLTTSIPTAGSYNITATYSGDGNYTAVAAGQSNSVPITVTGSTTPGFTLSAAPGSLTIAPGGAVGTSTITVTDVGGFTGNVTLAASGLPSGVTAGFSPNPTAATSTLTLTASGSAATGGPTKVTITGTSGALTASTTVALTVAQDFSVPATLTNPPAANPGQSTSTTMLISPVGGTTFASNVTYTCTAGLPTGISSCLFTPASPITAGSSATTVTVTIQTLGPFAGTAGVPANERPRMRSQNQRLWLPLSLPLAGMLLVGLAGRRLPRAYKIVGLCLALAFTGFLVACGGGSSSTTPPPVIGVTVSPSTVNTLYPNLTGAPAQTQQFSATVSNTTSQTVTWAVTGGSANGTIDPNSGLYTAPSSLPNPNSAITITATSAATTNPGTATVNLKTPTAAGSFPITVTVTEGSLPPKTTTFTLTVN